MNNSDKWWKSGKSYFGFDKNKSKYKSSLGWEESKLYDNYYTSYSQSTYFYPTSKKEDTEKINNLEKILNKAYQTTRDMIVILDFPFPVDIDFEGSYNHEYDSRRGYNKRRIFIPTEIFDEPDSKYSESDKIGIFCGQGVHEAAHLKFTTFKNYKTFINTLNKINNKNLSDEERKTCDADGNTLVNLVQLFINIIEDERVEDALLKERPGYSQFIIKTKNWKYNLFEQHLAESLTLITKESEEESLKFIANVIKLIRFPENIDFDFIEKYPDAFNEVVEALKNTPTCTIDSCNLGYSIYVILKKHFSEFSKKDSIKSLQELLKNTSFLKNAFRTTTEEILYGKDEDWGESPNITGISEGVIRNPIIGKIVTQKAFRGESDGTFFIKPDYQDKDLYKEIVKDIKKYVPSIRKLIKIKDKNYDFNIYGCRSGILDTNKLAEAYQGVSQVYVRQGKVSTPKTTVCILVDESGSMSCDDKCSYARRAAILINEALKGLPGLDLYIYGHTADENWEGSTELLVYKEGNLGNENSLVDIQGRHENRDGVAIKEAAARVRKFTDSHCLMFVLSDGIPEAFCYGGSDAIEDVRNKVEEIRKDNFDIIQITIDGSDTDIEDSKEMFGEKYVVDLRDDLSHLPLELSKIIKKCVLNNMGSSTTL